MFLGVPMDILLGIFSFPQRKKGILLDLYNAVKPKEADIKEIKICNLNKVIC
jgi:hypothetical protein